MVEWEEQILLDYCLRHIFHCLGSRLVYSARCPETEYLIGCARSPSETSSDSIGYGRLACYRVLLDLRRSGPANVCSDAYH